MPQSVGFVDHYCRLARESRHHLRRETLELLNHYRFRCPHAGLDIDGLEPGELLLEVLKIRDHLVPRATEPRAGAHLSIYGRKADPVPVAALRHGSKLLV